jgi:hypothetical protein
MIPTLNASALTLISAADSTTGWSGWGANSTKWGTSTDIYRENGISVALAPFATGDGGFGVTGITAFDATARLVMVWVFVTSPAFVNSLANYGVYIRLATGTDWTSAYRDYYVGGNDVAWVGSGWRLIVVDANRTANRSNGSPTMTAITRVGVGFNVAATASKSDVLCIDKLFHGTYLEVTTPEFTDGSNGIDFTGNSGTNSTIVRQDGGSWVTDGYESLDFVRIDGAGASIDGTYQITGVTASTLTCAIGWTGDSLDDLDAIVAGYCTLDDIYQKDGPTDDNWWGVVAKNRDGAYEINYRLVLGDVSGALACHWISRGEIIVGADQALNNGTDDDLCIQTVTDTGNTRVLIGESSGTGDDRVGYGGSVFTRDDRALLSKAGDEHWFKLLFTDATTIEMYGSTVIELGTTSEPGVEFPDATGHYVTNVAFISTGEVQLGQVEARNLTFSGLLSASTGALLWNANIDIANSFFIGNYYAIRHTSTGTYDYVGLQFSANYYDVYNNTGGSLTINNNESNATTSFGSVTFVTTVTLKVTVKDVDGNPVETAQTGIYALETVGAVTKGDELLTGSGGTDTNASGIAQNTGFNYPGDIDVEIRVRKASSTDDPKYRPLESPGLVGPTGLDVIVTLLADPVNT